MDKDPVPVQFSTAMRFTAHEKAEIYNALHDRANAVENDLKTLALRRLYGLRMKRSESNSSATYSRSSIPFQCSGMRTAEIRRYERTKRAMWGR